jgi:uncharacterized protein (TIGR03437 family)
VCADRNGNVYIADLGNARVRKISSDGKISTVAGGGAIAPGGDGEGSPAVNVKLSAPRNVIADLSGNLYISDFSGQRVLKVDLNGTLTTIAGSGTAGYSGDGASAVRATIAYPAGLAMDRLGVLYVADSGNKKIRRVYEGFISSLNTQQLNVPTGLAVDRFDNLYIADGRTILTRLTPQGAVNTLTIGGGDVAVDAFDNIYASDAHMVKRLGAGAVTVVAGTGYSSYAGDGGSGTSARLNSPVGLANDAAGNLYFADSRNQRVRKLNTHGIVSTVPGTQAAVAHLGLPSSIAFDSGGNLLIADTTANRIRRVAPDGTIVTIAGADEAGLRGDDGAASKALLSGPTGIAIDHDNNLYIADTGNNRIRKITASGQISTIAGGGLSMADDGPALTLQLIQPIGVALDRNGNIYIAESGANRIRLLTRSGGLSTVVDSHTVNLNQPRGLRVTNSGDVIFASAGNNRILQLSAAGGVTTIAGTGIAGFSGDGGPSTECQLSGPVDVAVDPDGSIWVSDTGNNRIRKLTPVGVVQPVTLAPITAVHGATMREQPLAPGEIISIFGTGLGPEAGVAGKVTSSNTLEREVAGVQVLFDETPAPLFFVQDKQINVQVPYKIAGHTETEVTVVSGGVVKGLVKLAVKETVPGLLTVSGGKGQAIAVNENGRSNSEGNPAPRGSVVILYATGDGQTGPDAVDGRPAAAAWTSYPVAVDFGGYAGEVLYAGRAPGSIGLMQINVRVPAEFVPSGAVPVWLTVKGEISQSGVTVNVR